MKGNIKYIIALLLFVACIFILQELAPNEYSWDSTFDSEDKGPYGLFILRNTLDRIIPGVTITESDSTIYQTIKDTTTKGTYLIIKPESNIDKITTRELLEWVDRGNTVFIAAISLGSDFEDTLGIEVKADFVYDLNTDSIYYQVYFVNPNLTGQKKYMFQGPNMAYYFSKIDTARTNVISVLDNSGPDFIAVRHGRGMFYLCLLPYAFTNYHYLLEKNTEFVDKALSYLPKDNILWDRYGTGEESSEQSSARYLLSDRSLSWVYFLMITGLFAFVMFSVKRRQRPIPVIEKPKNTTVEFVRTLAELYFYKPDHKKLAEKKISYFMEYLRRHYNFDTKAIDDRFITRLSSITQMSNDRLIKIFEYLNLVGDSEKITRKQLLELNKQLDTIYKRIKNV